MSDQHIVVDLGLPFTPQKISIRPIIHQSPAYPASEGSVSILDESTDHIFDSPLINRSISKFNDSFSPQRRHAIPLFIDEGVDVSIRDDNPESDSEIPDLERSVVQASNRSFLTLNEDELNQHLGSFREDMRSIGREQDDEIERLTTTLVQFHEERARLADEQSVKQHEIDEARDRIQSLELELEIQQQKTNEVHSEHRAEIAALNQTVVSQSSELATHAQTISTLQFSINDLKQANETYSRQLSEAVTTQSLLTEQLTAAAEHHAADLEDLKKQSLIDSQRVDDAHLQDVIRSHTAELLRVRKDHENMIHKLVNEHQIQLRDTEESYRKQLEIVEASESAKTNLHAANVTKLTSKLTAQQDVISTLTLQITSLRAEISSNAEHLQHHKQISDKYQMQIREQHQSLATQESTITQLAESVKDRLDQQSALYEQRLTQLSAEHDRRSTSLISDHEASVNELVSRHEKQMKDLQRDLDELRSSAASLTARNQELRAHHDVFRQNVATAQPNSAEAVEERRVRHEIERHEMARRGLERECVALKKRLQAKIDECSKLTAMCDEKVERCEFDDLVERLRGLEQERKQLLAANDNALQDSQTRRVELDEARHAVAESSKERSQLKHALESAQVQVESTSRALADTQSHYEEVEESMRKSLVEERAQTKRLAFRLDECEATVAQLRDKLDVFEAQLSERDDVINHLQQQVDGYSSSSEDESMTRQQRYCKAKHTIKAAYDTLVSAESHVTTLAADNAAMQQALQQRDTTIASLQAEVADTTAGRRRARQAAKQLKARCEKLKTQLHEEKENHHSVNTKLLRRLDKETSALRQAYNSLLGDVPRMLKSFSQTVLVDVARRAEALQLQLDDANNDRASLSAAMNALQARMSWRYESLLQAHEKHHRQYAALLKAQEQLKASREHTLLRDMDEGQVDDSKQHRRSRSSPRDM